MYWVILLIVAIMIAELAAILWCTKLAREVRRSVSETDTPVNLVVKKKEEWISVCVVCLLYLIWIIILCFISPIWYAMGMVTVGLMIFLGSIYYMIDWLDGVILYDEQGFSLSCIPSHVKYYYYEDITDIAYYKSDYAIFVGDFRIGSRYYKQELKEFLDYVLQKTEEMGYVGGGNENPDLPLSCKVADFFKMSSYAVLFIGGIVLQFFNIWFFFVSSEESGMILTIMCFLMLEYVSILEILEGLGYFAVKERKCQISEQGLSVKYPWKDWTCIKWDEFRQICICYRGLNQHSRYETIFKYDPVICFVKEGEKKNLHDRWKVDSLLHYKRVIWMDYTEQLLKEIQDKYPYEVVDLRKTRQYRTDCKSKWR